MKTAKFTQAINEISEISSAIDTQNKKLAEYRSRELLGKITTFTKSYVTTFDSDKLVSLFNFLWEDKYKSVAFQSALVMTALIIAENFDKSRGIRLGDLLSNFDAPDCIDNSTLSEFLCDYLDSINKFFAPQNLNGLKRLLSLFKGEPSEQTFRSDDISTWDFNKDGHGPRFSTVVAKKMDPKFWCAYRYILLEIYSANSNFLGGNSGHSDGSFESLRQIVNSQVVSLRTVLVKRVYKEVSQSFKDSGDCEDVEIPKLSVESTVRRINKILENCGVRSGNRITDEFVKNACEGLSDEPALDIDAPDIDDSSEDSGV
jgi:hypothetical protein